MNSLRTISDEVLLKKFTHLNLVGSSAEHITFIRRVKKIAEAFFAPVLIQGETGTGKENTARAIHYLSDRQDQGFFPINCGAIPDSLLESELFGHEKGAFTNAHQRQAGIVELAEGGTLFLDEVDSLSPKAQAALLRFIQSGEYRPLGGRKTKLADVRIIAATNANLSKAVKDNQFREDLLFRLNVFNIGLAPLRERQDDIAIIANTLLEKFSENYQQAKKHLSTSSLDWIKQQPWEGNIRELENLLLREFLLSETEEIQIQEANSQTLTGKEEQPGIFKNFQRAKHEMIESFERDYLKSALKKTAGNVTEAAKLAGKERRAFGKLLKKHDIDRSLYEYSA